MNNEIKLQYQLSNGNWTDCEDRTEEFLTRCEEVTGKTRNEIITILNSGETVRNDRADWYSNCRCGNAAARISTQLEANRIANRDYPEGRKLDCGHIVYYKAHEMNASLGSSCCVCYDRMSD